VIWATAEFSETTALPSDSFDLKREADVVTIETAVFQEKETQKSGPDCYSTRSQWMVGLVFPTRRSLWGRPVHVLPGCLSDKQRH
jgi:hypothetical protein